MILNNLIYIYQLEHYDKKRFIAFAYRNINWFSINKKGGPDWTIRSGLIFSLDILIIISLSITAYYFAGLTQLLLLLFLCFIFLPVMIIFADILISPLVLFQKNKIIRRAQKVIQGNKERGLITIGITGSFGKTSMKNILVNVLKEKYKVFTFPGNINTDVGMAHYLIKHRRKASEADILVSEMGAYKKGEIKKMSEIIKPCYSIITSIGECHLDRFGSLENIISAKFELANAAEKEVFLNYCDDNIKKHAGSKIAGNIKTIKVCGGEESKNIKYLDNFGGIAFEYGGEVFNTKIIADYVVDFFIIAFKIARKLQLSISEIKRGFEKADSVPHRLEVIRNKELDRVIIDDSYNGNYAGFLSGLKILNRAKGRKVVLTPGIVELGRKRSREIHENLAQKYIENADLVLLIKNRNTEFIMDKFKKRGYNNFKAYKTVKEAHNDLANVLKRGDTIIFQNDLSDNYY